MFLPYNIILQNRLPFTICSMFSLILLSTLVLTFKQIGLRRKEKKPRKKNHRLKDSVEIFVFLFLSSSFLLLEPTSHVYSTFFGFRLSNNHTWFYFYSWHFLMRKGKLKRKKRRFCGFNNVKKYHNTFFINHDCWRQSL
jgi:hypothetical protein